ncbi:DEAD/DEAH box helicase family protein [Abyssisolibacter fermentans]|uniref:DEAD/DEAH box helicase family protein n=1 Tax=Abyssisolibacter fermentans TaxID=1766203 RepID=UPI00083608DE|nr:DEAD/DEAH box helicase family protein [Abyssisolibacter fermentans]
MNELHLQNKFLIPFFTDNVNGLGYREVKANTIANNLIIEEDLREFLSSTELNKSNYEKLLKKFKNNEHKLMKEFVDYLIDRMKNYRNMALFINDTKTITFEGVKLYLFYVSGSETYGNRLFEQNIFSVVQELPYKYKYNGREVFSFRPDISFFVNGIYLGYSELKSNYNNQNARKNGRIKVVKDYKEAVIEYLKIAQDNDKTQKIRKDFLKVFEKAIHITTTDVGDTYIIRNIADYLDNIRTIQKEGKYDYDSYKLKVLKNFKPYPLLNNDKSKTGKLKEVFSALYSKEMIEKEILYYNFIERETIKKDKVKQLKNERGRLISPRPKQKFGVDKIMSKIDELLIHENEDDYFINKLRKELSGVSEDIRNDLIKKRLKYQNNKNVYSLLLQYAAGFGKSNIIGWSALQLKDIKRDGKYVYDKIMLIVDRVQLRDQLDSKMFNMNIDNKMFVEASDKRSFINALSTDKRIVIVNLQKFNTIKEVLSDDILDRLANMRIVFLIDEIHRSNSGKQHNEMISLFDELQSSFDSNKEYVKNRKHKNLLIGFTATPSDHTLARFGEFSKYAEGEKIWKPFDSYTMKEAIEDGYILNPLKGIVPVSAKMYYELPNDITKGVNNKEKEYRIVKKKVYENEDRIDATSKFIVERLVKTTYRKIRGQAKAMLATTSIKSAIKYKECIEKYYDEAMNYKNYQRFKDAPVYIVYSGDGQKYSKASNLNNGKSEVKVLQEFALCKNGLIIVVDKLQTGFDEPRLHTLFLDKEIRAINAIQTISRVNRTTKHKNECKIVDFSHKNVNVNNIKEAFEHFSDVVISDFDPFGELKGLENIYDDLIDSSLYKKYFKMFLTIKQGKEKNVHNFLEFEDGLARYIRNNPERSKKLKKKINRYFQILNLVEFVIEFDPKYNEINFLEFWKRYNNEYNNINKPDNLKDDVEVYFDNQIGIVNPPEKDENKRKTKGNEDGESGGEQMKFDILKIIQQKNQEEETIGELIKEFEEKIEKLFLFTMKPENGRNLIAKMKDIGTKFSEEEIYSDFTKIYRKFKIKYKREIGEFFFKETEDIIDKLCDDFEEYVNKNNF